MKLKPTNVCVGGGDKGKRQLQGRTKIQGQQYKGRGYISTGL